METMIVELTHKRALQLLRDLEAMEIIKLHDNTDVPKPKLSEKYKGILSKEESQDLTRHISQMRNEWSNI
ncbi:MULTISPECIES: hypothetical protein [Dyadobacter]|jgi:hypothetical protein|uniref:Uncharacterized protein n=1 Tax=Dyadobacter chenhuakuii TaxID=2909339 RepID=A0ABY4XJ56_9BACT|nr:MULTISPECIES: hypothetical protein [Dyadobacter]MCF2496427.1 hypothetical protein [Dyadobacter chenhuakuii]MCF2519406.1 hypothetical protein [Dyadobacter sp. CY351]USJ30484.1 hypothetical protein NFI80_21825 [Dyadobacter chenhuakuii]